MDEPFGALDAQTRALMQAELLRIWQRTRKPVIFVTHDVHEAVFFAERIAVMSARPEHIEEIVETRFDADDPELSRSPAFVEMADRVWNLSAQRSDPRPARQCVTTGVQRASKVPCRPASFDHLVGPAEQRRSTGGRARYCEPYLAASSGSRSGRGSRRIRGAI